MAAEASRAAGGAPRRLGAVAGESAGPLLICTGGIHGNEPAGLAAAAEVLAELGRRPGRLRGRFVVLAGNRAALAAGRRFLARDLNRIWLPEHLAGLESPAGPDDAEAVEQRELLAALREEIGAAGDREVFFLDLHTSSAPGIPFVCIGDTLRNRRFARRFPVPVILGLEEQVDGALLEFLNNAGVVTLGFEGGQHEAPESIENLAAAIWTGLGSAGLLPRRDDRVRAARRLLHRRRQGVPRVLEIRYRHGLTPGDGFRMRPGYRNFQAITAGEALADDRDGPIYAFYDARVLLPLYQGLGDDGFFLAREVSRFWLWLSRLLRRLRLGTLLPLLPGVERLSVGEDAVLADPRVARWFTIEIFHLLGYRKRRRRCGRLLFSRRRHDLGRPPRIAL
ncbi:MAG: aspartoacylase [Planctomycetota bacterium]|nr:MAG: aspartoacylase [Planctomycetota bacterium]